MPAKGVRLCPCQNNASVMSLQVGAAVPPAMFWNFNDMLDYDASYGHTLHIPVKQD